MSPNFNDLLAGVKREIDEIAPRDVEEGLGRPRDFALLDVREKDEWDQGHIDGALFLPRGFLEVKVEKLLQDKDQPVVVYCAGGVRSAFAAKSLRELGYRNVRSMAGGIRDWKDLGFPLVVPETVDKDRMARYSRHLLIPEVGEEGQLKLFKIKVLLVGAGGLGSPAALYLAASGVGTLGLVDDDVVDESNLQRQILHWTSSIGTPKTDSGRRTLFEVNPDVKVRTHNLRLNASNVEEVFAGYDVIVSGSDNFQTAYLVNDAAVLLGKPVAYGSIFRFEGQASTFIPHQGPCYRCLYAAATPPELAPSCAEAGVLGVLPGTIGMIQATEAIKLLLGLGEPLAGRLLVYDALEQSFREFKVRRDPECRTCGENARIELVDGPDAMCATG